MLPNPKCLLTLSVSSARLFQWDVKHVRSSQGLPLFYLIWSVGVDEQTARLRLRQSWQCWGCWDIPFGELQTHAYLHCVLLLALDGDTDGPRRSYKRRVRGALQGWGLRRRSRQRGLLALKPGIEDLGGFQIIFLVWRIWGRGKPGCCFNWEMMGCGETLGILDSTWRGGKEVLIGRETHKWGRGGFSGWYHWGFGGMQHNVASVLRTWLIGKCSYGVVWRYGNPQMGRVTQLAVTAPVSSDSTSHSVSDASIKYFR